MSYALRWCKEHYPIGARVNIKRFRWISFKDGVYEEDRCNGTVIKHWRATGDMPAFTVLCDDGREFGGEFIHLEPREVRDEYRGQMALF